MSCTLRLAVILLRRASIKSETCLLVLAEVAFPSVVDWSLITLLGHAGLKHARLELLRSWLGSLLGIAYCVDYFIHPSIIPTAPLTRVCLPCDHVGTETLLLAFDSFNVPCVGFDFI